MAGPNRTCLMRSPGGQNVNWVSDTQLQKQLVGQPPKTQEEIIRINTQARHIALQVALLIPILAGLIGLLISFRMMRLPDPQQSASGEQVVLG